MGMEVSVESVIRRHSGLPPRIFVDLAAGRLTATEIDAVVEAVRVSALVAPPEWMLDRATALARTQSFERAPVQLANLAFDSKGQVVLAGARAVALRSRRLLYETGAASLDLEVTGVRGRRDLQVSGHVRARSGEQPHEVRFDHAAHQYILSVDRHGEFEVDALRGGEYAIEVDFGQWVMAVPQVTL